MRGEARNLKDRHNRWSMIGAAALSLLWASAAAAEPANSPFNDAAKGNDVAGVDQTAAAQPASFALDAGEALNSDPDTLTGRPAPSPTRPAPASATPTPTREEGAFKANSVPLDTGAPYDTSDWPTFWPPRFLP
jgi:hypothetical protein